MGEETKELRRLVIKADDINVEKKNIFLISRFGSSARKNGISIRIRSWILYRFQRKCLGILVMESLIP